MLKKLKRSFIYFMCTVLLVTSISMSAYKPLKVNATGLEIAIGVGGYELLMLLLDGIAAGLVCCGAYNLYEDDERFAQVVDEYLGGITGTWDESLVKWIPQGKETHYGKTWVLDPTDPTCTWREPGELKQLTPEELEEWAPYGAKPLMDMKEWMDMVSRRAEEVARKNHPEWFEEEPSGGGGGDSGGDGDKEPEHPTHDWKAMLKEYWNSNSDTLIKIGSGVTLSIGGFLEKLFSGEIDTSDSPALDEWLNSNMNNISYTGELEKIDGQVLITVSTTYNYTTNYVVSSAYGSGSFTGERFAIYPTYSNGNYYSSYSLVGKDSNGNWIYPTFYGVVTTKYSSDGSITGTSTGTWKNGSIGYATTISANIPIFATQEAFQNYLDTGDDSAAINKEKPKFTMLDMKGMASNFPTTFAPLTSGKAVTDKALKDYIDGMTDYKNTADPESLTDPDTHTQKAQETIQKAVEDNEVKEETKPEPAPLPDIPNPDKITIDGSEATRDWRLVFPFCIPFDIIDLIRVFQAEPQAPRFEIPLKVEEYGIDYTFVLDLAPFESLAVIFRLFERIMFILGLAVLTGKVIKW